MVLLLSIALLAVLALLWALLAIERVPTGEAQGASDCGSEACALQWCVPVRYTGSCADD